MSYRLVDANILADKYPEVNDMPCVYADLPNGLNGAHYNFPAEDTDAISREAVMGLLESRYSFDTVMSIYEEVLELPSVNPATETKTISTDSGKWVYNTTTETLAKIRAEIKSLSDLGILQEVWLCDVLDIIDKYSKGGESDA